MIRLPRTKKGLAAYVIAITAVTFSIFATANSTPLKISRAPSPAPLAQTSQTAVLGDQKNIARVTRVIDGDTFEIEGGQKVRLIGVDAPELTDKRKAVQCYAKAATDFLTLLVKDKEIELKKDVSETDGFGRLLRYAYLDGFFINKQLIESGYAYAKSFAPDVTYQADFKAAQKQAVTSHNGLWGDTCSN